MNQILVTDKLLVTKKIKRKKKMYKIQFIVSLILVALFSVWYIYSEIEKNASEAVSQEILGNIDFNDETASNKPLVVALDENAIEESNETGQVIDGIYKDSDGNTYKYESIVSIPKLGIEYPVLSETTEELLKISVNKFWGPDPNTVGNYCVVGHNYKSGKMFGKLSQIKNGDIVKITDLTGKTLQYKVYNKYVVYPEDVACTSQVTNGLKEATLITCTNGGKQRLIVKCREI